MLTLPEYTLLFWITAVFAILLIGIAKAGIGGGVGVVATPLLALTIPVAEAAALVLPILIVADLLAVQQYRQQYDNANLRILLPSALVGIVLGSFFFTYFSENDRALKVGIGIIGLLFIAYQLGRTVILRNLAQQQPSPMWGYVLGTVSGFTSTLAHVGGPPMAIYLLPQRLPRNIFVGTSAVFFMIVNAVKLIPYGFLGLLRLGNLTTTLLLLPLAFIGIRLGVWLNGRFSEAWFNRVVYIILAITSIQLILGESFISLLTG